MNHDFISTIRKTKHNQTNGYQVGRNGPKPTGGQSRAKDIAMVSGGMLSAFCLLIL